MTSCVLQGSSADVPVMKAAAQSIARAVDVSSTPPVPESSPSSKNLEIFLDDVRKALSSMDTPSQASIKSDAPRIEDLIKMGSTMSCLLGSWKKHGALGTAGGAICKVVGRGRNSLQRIKLRKTVDIGKTTLSVLLTRKRVIMLM